MKNKRSQLALTAWNGGNKLCNFYTREAWFKVTRRAYVWFISLNF